MVLNIPFLCPHFSSPGGLSPGQPVCVSIPSEFLEHHLLFIYGIHHQDALLYTRERSPSTCIPGAWTLYFPLHLRACPCQALAIRGIFELGELRVLPFSCLSRLEPHPG